MNAPLFAQSSLNQIVTLQFRALRLKPGAAMPGTRINPVVSSAYERAVYRDSQSRQPTVVPTHDEIAAHLGVPVEVPNILHEIDLLNAQAVLRGAILSKAIEDWTYRGRRQSSPINPTTIAAAIKLVTDADAASMETLVQQAEERF